ncbi:MAG TPA: glutamine--fructose-6-phosphate transaminase (isomerizing) [Gammaproteobacteria bacterium]|nr:glutamine--fructose-6-phosphate transaminase (isomerizing) [Gammaproteobacteria bacterium]
MCGITAGVAQRDVAPILLEGLKRLEYRGYDSAGIAVLNPQGALERVRVCGKVNQLADSLESNPLLGTLGVAHTRWATHGKPCEKNAHPHFSGGEIALVHNGIIENYLDLRQALAKKGCTFESETDSEIIAHSIAYAFKEKGDLLQAVVDTLKHLEGAYSIAVMAKSCPNKIIAARHGSPLVIGLGLGENFVASDSLALLPVAHHVVVLEEGDVAEISRQSYEIFDVNHKPVERLKKRITITEESADKGKYRHFMQKEIFEQPKAITATLSGRILNGMIEDKVFGVNAGKIFDQTKAVQIVGCGTSYHAGMVARFWLQELLGLPCQAEIASEFRYRRPVVSPGTLYVTLSQSGETADTLAALGSATSPAYCGHLAVCNVPDSALVRQTPQVFLTHAGPEIGVASTKAFTTQLVALLMLAACLGRRVEGGVTLNKEVASFLRQLPALMTQILELDPSIQKIAKQFADKRHALYLGRGIHYPVVKEGALKLKEISYIHADAYPAGELKHGPLALVDQDMPVVVVLAKGKLLDKVKSNIEEVRARDGQLFVLTEQEVDVPHVPEENILRLPTMPELLKPILFSVPLQLLAYHVAVAKGTDVDQPRNLAKSVTVE